MVERGIDAETLKYPSRVALRLPAAKLGKLLLKLRRADTVLVGEIGLIVNRVLLFSDIVKALVAHDNGVEHGVCVVHILVLAQHGHTALGVKLNRA